MTSAECILWNCLRANRLESFHFRRQQVIGAFFVDFYCHAAGVIVEVDGGIHLQQREYDAAREEIIAGHGLIVLRFTNEDVVERLPEVVEKIARVCRERVDGT